jgi:WD40 repeat protein
MPESNHSPSKLLAIWETLLGSRIPWLGSMLQRFAVIQLSQQLRQGSPQALSVMFIALNSRLGSAIQINILAELSGPLSPACNDRMWEEWSACRLACVETILLKKSDPARAQSPAWSISQAKLGQMHWLYNAAPGRIVGLIALLSDIDPTVAANARSALSELSIQASRDELFNQWAISRSPVLWQLAIQSGYTVESPVSVRTLFLLKKPDPDQIRHATADMIPYLVKALTDSDPAIAAEARRDLPMLQDHAAIELLAQIWSKTRTTLLAKILIEGRLLPIQPYELRLLTALLIDRSDIARDTTPEGLPALLNLTLDQDANIAANARTALANLTLPESKSALCMLAVYQNDPAACQIALQAGYRPEKPEQRALFVFLAGLTDEYLSIDFDQRLMRTVYETSQPELRQRIASQVQRSGQTAFLTILAGIDFRNRAAYLTNDEVQLFVDLLINNQEWSRLWPLVHTLAFSWSVRILQVLRANGWTPSDENDLEEFNLLCQLSQDIPRSKTTYIQDVPPVIPSAVIHVNGRVNDLAFDPIQPVIAIGTGARQLVTWNFQKAALVRVRKGFNHSICRVAYVGKDYLVCGVRSNTDSACWVYGWQQEEAFVLSGHRGSVTALEPVNDTTLLSTGRDGAVILWDLAQRAEFHRCTVPEWPRRAVISPDRSQVAILHSSIQMLHLPELLDNGDKAIRTISNSNTQPSIAQCAAFLPQESTLLLGQRNGQILKYTRNRSGTGYNRKAVLSLESRIIGLKYMHQRQIVVCAAQNGKISFFRWPDMTTVGAVTAEGGQLTSLQISPDGSFMATGTGESSMLLWDLRVLDFPTLIDLPLANANADYLAVVTGLLNSPNLTTPLRQVLKLLKALLLRRLRFDIQIDELAQIQPGEFDILID